LLQLKETILNTLLNENLDHSEINKFASIASSWWDPEGEFKPLHSINPLRLDFIERGVGGLFGKSVLDVGCGGGILSEAMASRGAQVTGIDMAEASLEVARLHGRESGVSVNYVASTAESFAQHHGHQFDVVTCMEMLEHGPDPASVVNACAGLVKPGGHIFFSTLNRNIKSWLMAIVAAEYVLGWVPKGTHQHSKFIRPSELLRMCDHAGLLAEEAMGLHFDPLSQGYYLSGKNIDVNYMIRLSAPSP
jgi:2-polyprenyl-6-hydroxyphenyl methylase/3-demethylubiquinone-9 3-methyltransferase